MNLVHIVPYFPPARCFGGTPEAVFSLASAQANCGNDVFILTTDAGLDSLSTESSQDIEIKLEWLNTKSIRAMGRWKNLQILYTHNRIPWLANRMKVFTATYWNDEINSFLPPSIDIAHFHEVHIPGYRKAAETARQHGAKIFVSPHGSLKPPIHRGFPKVAHLLLDPLLRRGWFNQVDGFMSLCKTETEQLLLLGITKEKIHTLPHGLPQFTSIPIEKTPEYNNITFLYVGRLNPAKGVPLLLDAFISAWKQGCYTRLILCGPDEGMGDRIAQQCWKENIPFIHNSPGLEAGIILLPPRSRETLPSLYQQADYTLCPSPYESYGLVPLESLLCGTPVLIAPTYGCLDHLPQGTPGLRIVSPHTVGSWVQEIMRCQKKSGETPLFSLPIPTWQEIAMQTIQLYSEQKT